MIDKYIDDQSKPIAETVTEGPSSPANVACPP